MAALPFKHQVEPLGQSRHPQHRHPGPPADEVGEGEEEQDGSFGVSHVGDDLPQPLLLHRPLLQGLGH